ncbi:MAG: dihydroorotate dehydrogenase electron transfer subunit [Clostridiales bacterium]|nr:dihydroorotate dehydrogenase electron transfer subunit [Clostridiales bacterium]
MKPIVARLTISKIECFDGSIYRVDAASETELPHIAAGQFAHVKVPNKSLRRPICVYKSDKHTIMFIIADVGEGTHAFVMQEVGDKFDAILPLGNGFPVLPDKTDVVLLGGGTGCAPLLKIAEDNPSLNVTALLGFRNAAAMGVYKNDFDSVCKRVLYCTDDGSYGHLGFPTDLLNEVVPQVLYVCGAHGMVKTAQEYCKKHGVIGYASMEQRMGCGVGACLVCSVNVIVDGKQKLLRACADGPVFPLEDIVL